MADRRPLFSREELLGGGLPARRATTLLFAIESRTAQLVARSRRAMATFETERSVAEREQAFLAALAAGRTLPLVPRIQDLERYATSWASLVPPEADARAALGRLLGQKYRLPRRWVPSIRSAIGLDEAATGAAFQRQFTQPIDTIYVRDLTLRERLAWMRASAAHRLEDLPPFWLAFALTLTETVGAGILALPIALAGIGVLPGVALLLVFGLVNAATMAALVEAITRNGHMRYGSAYFGRLVGDYLGRPGTVVLSAALFVFNSATLLIVGVGFGSVLRDATGVPGVVWAATLFAVNVAILRRKSLDATVAFALLVGIVNIVIIVTISAIALSNLRPEYLLEVPILRAGGTDVAVSLGALVFGVVLMAYFGHTSAGNAAKVVLQRDPTGRALLRGSVAAMLTVVGLYVLAVVAITGAVGTERLIGHPGTALEPLAERAGPIVRLLGAVFGLLAMGLGSIYFSLGLANQVREWLPSSWSTGVRGRLPLTWLPSATVFGMLVLLFLGGQESFTGPFALVGTLSLPILAGIFPMLMILSARARGEYVPGTFVGWLGRPAATAVIGGLFLAAVVAHAAVIWQDPLQRSAAAMVAGVMAAVAILAIRRGAFDARTILELRREPGPHDLDRWVGTATSDGRPLPVAWTVHESGGAVTRPVSAEASLSTSSLLPRTDVDLPADSPLELKLWLHAVDVDGVSRPLAGRFAVRSTGRPPTGGPAQAPTERAFSGEVVFPIDVAGDRISIVPEAG